MRCTDPRKVGFKADGKTISWSPKTISKEFATFQLPCGQCIECRLDYSRQWAIRCVHESQMHDHNCFITLTYSDENLKNPKLDYSDFQKFMKRLRKTQTRPIGMFVTGEYGEHNKRPHWHAIIFNYSPPDIEYSHTNDNGDRIYNSKTIDKLWGKNDPDKCPTAIGSVSFKSAGYVARYAAKKLVHGKDGEHEFNPISKKSSKHAIGKKWLEKYYSDIFDDGKNILVDGTQVPIPRYYEKWLKKYHPVQWEKYITNIKSKIISDASAKTEAEILIENSINDERFNRDGIYATKQRSKKEAQKIITESKFKMLQNYLKL